MAHLIHLPSFTDSRGSLTVLDKDLPFSARRIYYIYGVEGDQIRAGHRHKRNRQVLISVCGRCEIYINDGVRKQTFLLDRPDQGLVLEAQDWHTMYGFTPNTVLLVLASEPYDVNDYIDEEYP